MVPMPKRPLRPTFFAAAASLLPLGVREAQPPATAALPQNPIFRLQVVDDVLLAAVHPTGRDRKEKLKG